jgi:hypothetical protein
MRAFFVALGLLVLLLATLPLRAASGAHPRQLALAGTVTNTTGDVAATARLTLTITGEGVTARLATEKPLSGSGELRGTLRQGWLELNGKLDEGFTIQFRGVLNSRDYRGTYIAGVPGTPVQYGKFQLVVAQP